MHLFKIYVIIIVDTTVDKRGYDMRKYEDLSGREYGQLKVISRAENQITKSGHINVMYNCECKCGKRTIVRATALKNGSIKSCGCSRKTSLKGKNLNDLTGRDFGRWHVMYRADSITEPSGKQITMWHCKCKCGTERDLRASSLVAKTTLSCGCLKNEILSIDRDLSDQQFDRWHVMYKAETVHMCGRNIKMWHCRCECGVEKDVSENSLLGKKSKSCGCYRRERAAVSVTYDDLSGQKFGFWTVLERAPDRFYPSGGRAMMWRCRCVCNQIHIVAGNMLKSGISQSCGCKSQPHMESYVRQYLDDRGYVYETQKTYDDLLGVGGGKLSYDFLVYSNNEPYIYIECQGEQHYRPVDYFGGVQRFEIQQTHDSLKRAYAEKLGIRLIEVKYTLLTPVDVFAYLDDLFECSVKGSSIDEEL